MNLTKEQTHEAILKAIQEKGKFKQSRLIYSMNYDINEKLTENAVIIEHGKYKSQVLEGATYLDIAVLANDMIHTTKNYHNIFLENIKYLCEKNGIEVYSFVMGS